MLALASQGEPYGVLRFKGKVPTTAELFRLIAPRGTRRDDFERWLGELETCGVFDRDVDGAPRSPRMYRDGVLAFARAEAAKQSWKDKPNQRQPRDLHVQADGNGAGFARAKSDFASTEAEADADADAKKNPPRGPPACGGGGRGRSSSKRLPGFVGMVVDISERRRQ